SLGVLGRIVSRRCAAAGMAISHFAGDVTDMNAVDAWLSEAAPTLVLHFAALVSVTAVESDPLRAYEVNALGTYSVAAATIRHAPTAWLFLASTSHVYAPTPPGDTTPRAEDAQLGPATYYGVSKLAAEQLAAPILAHCEVDHCIGRIFSFSHETQKPPYLVPSLRAEIASLPDGSALRVFNSNAVRDILDAETIVDALLALAARRVKGTFNIGAGTGLTVAAIANKLVARAGKRITVEAGRTAYANSLVADVTKLRAVLASGGIAS
ncbi:MAG: NAD-dependent epimerase/dehydratase family protein, partial [Chloroflexia bacterium]|nr:NAD-dependent epimerase/dehydratase family protein [Chloroflexia bacterium]